jgi:hypothetical protein
MGEDISLMEFLNRLSICSGDEAIGIITNFQCGALTVEGVDVNEAEEWANAS